MANIIVRESKHRIDPSHPQSSDPDYRRDYEKGQHRLRTGQLKFANRGEEEHYWKMVRSNPSNVPGLDPTFPPLPEPKSFVHFEGLSDAERLKAKVERMEERSKQKIVLYCATCESMQTFCTSPQQTFCQKCGNFWRQSKTN